MIGSIIIKTLINNIYYHTFTRIEELLRGNEEEKKNRAKQSNNAGQQPTVAELSSPKIERRSRRSNRGHHWKFSEEKANSSNSPSPAVPEPPREAEDGSCSFSLALQAFAEEEDEEVPVDESSGTKRRRVGNRPRKRRQRKIDSDELSDPDDPGEVDTEESGRVLPVASAVPRTLDILQEPFRLLTFYRIFKIVFLTIFIL